MNKLIFLSLICSLSCFSIKTGNRYERDYLYWSYQEKRARLNEILRAKLRAKRNRRLADLKSSKEVQPIVQEKRQVELTERFNYFGYRPDLNIIIFPDAMLISLKPYVAIDDPFAYIFIVKLNNQYIGLLRQNKLITKLSDIQSKSIFQKHLQYLKYSNTNIIMMETPEITKEMKNLYSIVRIDHENLLSLLDLVEIELLKSQFFGDFLNKISSKELLLASETYKSLYPPKTLKELDPYRRLLIPRSAKFDDISIYKTTPPQLLYKSIEVLRNLSKINNHLKKQDQ